MHYDVRSLYTQRQYPAIYLYRFHRNTHSLYLSSICFIFFSCWYIVRVLMYNLYFLYRCSHLSTKELQTPSFLLHIFSEIMRTPESEKKHWFTLEITSNIKSLNDILDISCPNSYTPLIVIACLYLNFICSLKSTVSTLPLLLYYLYIGILHIPIFYVLIFYPGFNKALLFSYCVVLQYDSNTTRT